MTNCLTYEEHFKRLLTDLYASCNLIRNYCFYENFPDDKSSLEITVNNKLIESKIDLVTAIKDRIKCIQYNIDIFELKIFQTLVEIKKYNEDIENLVFIVSNFNKRYVKQFWTVIG